MMKRQARRSGGVMGFDTHTIAGSGACSPSTQPIHPTTTRETSPHYAGALAEDRVGIGVARIGDAAVAYKTNRLADPLDYATSDADRAEAWAFFPTGVDS
jgi:hypothetical protein